MSNVIGRNLIVASCEKCVSCGLQVAPELLACISNTEIIAKLFYSYLQQLFNLYIIMFVLMYIFIYL